MKNKKVILICAIALLCVGLVFAILCLGAGGKTEITLSVKSQGGLPLNDVKVRVFNDKALNEQLTVGETDRDGVVVFEGKAKKKYYVTLEDAPEGYELQESFEIVGENPTIQLKAVMLEKELGELKLELGSVATDFSITSVEGEEYKLSDLLKTKKAVVLNFWYIKCDPCNMEFPFMQEAYTEFDDIEILAINTYPTETAEDVSSFAIEKGLTFPMFKESEVWDYTFNLTAFPTTVVIDRYGTVCMVHKGAITSKEEFEQIFAYFTDDNYQQTLIKNISDIA